MSRESAKRRQNSLLFLKFCFLRVKPSCRPIKRLGGVCKQIRFCFSWASGDPWGVLWVLLWLCRQLDMPLSYYGVVIKMIIVWMLCSFFAAASSARDMSWGTWSASARDHFDFACERERACTILSHLWLSFYERHLASPAARRLSRFWSWNHIAGVLVSSRSRKKEEMKERATHGCWSQYTSHSSRVTCYKYAEALCQKSILLFPPHFNVDDRSSAVITAPHVFSTRLRVHVY